MEISYSKPIGLLIRILFAFFFFLKKKKDKDNQEIEKLKIPTLESRHVF